MWKHYIILALGYIITINKTFVYNTSTLYTKRLAVTYGTIEQARNTLLANCNPTTLYMNLGMIPETGFISYAHSAETLVRFVGTTANLSYSDEHVLDVGCGFGDQDMLFVREFNVKKINCIDVTPAFVSVANTRIHQAGLNDRIHVSEGDAISELRNFDSLDVIISIDSALHLDSRRKFFEESYNALRNGGRLVLSDQIIRNEDGRTEMLEWLEKNDSEFPESNLVFLDQYLKDFNDVGFRIDVLIDISNRTYSNTQDTVPLLSQILVSIYKNDTLSSDFLWAKGYDNVIFLVIVAVKEL